MNERRRPPRGARRREQIVEIARRRFTELGYDATTIGDIAVELDVSKAAIAYYFPTKDRFLDELLAPVIDELEAAVAAAGDGPRTVLCSYLDVLIRHHDLAIWMDTDPAVARSERYTERLSGLNSNVVSVITGRSRRKADRVRALGVLGGIWRPVREADPDDLERLRDDIVTVALEGYAAAVG